MTPDPILLIAISDIFLNLSAGWFGAAIIFPATNTTRSASENIKYVAVNLIFAVASLAFGYQLRILGS